LPTIDNNRDEGGKQKIAYSKEEEGGMTIIKVGMNVTSTTVMTMPDIPT
jgi:hypothetical protein